MRSARAQPRLAGLLGSALIELSKIADLRELLGGLSGSSLGELILLETLGRAGLHAALPDTPIMQIVRQFIDEESCGLLGALVRDDVEEFRTIMFSKGEPDFNARVAVVESCGRLLPIVPPGTVINLWQTHSVGNESGQRDGMRGYPLLSLACEFGAN
jgi:hypothetical protein